jgi:hypothetical protein
LREGLPRHDVQYRRRASEIPKSQVERKSIWMEKEIQRKRERVSERRKMNKELWWIDERTNG